MIVPRERKATLPQPVLLEKVLLVEGETPSHLFEALARSQGMDHLIEIRSYGGIQELATYLKTIVTTADFRAIVKSLGITRDAEEDPIAAKQSVDQAIANANLSNHLKVSVAILPDDQTKGMIETLFVRSVSTAPGYECIENFFECVNRHGITIPTSIKRDKHIAQVYLATRSNIQMMPGFAAYKGAWNLDHAVFDSLKKFLRSL